MMNKMKRTAAFLMLLMMAGSCGDENTPGTPGPNTNSQTNNNVATNNVDCKPSAGGVEICDGIDNNCDGNTDEGFNVGGECVVETGVCKGTGVYQCSSTGIEAVCSVAAPAVETEICDGIDNNCDGEIDEGFDVGTVCTVGVGECAVEATIQCGDDGGSACDAIPGDPGDDELCDGLDNNCDGEIDEGFATLGDACDVGVGACLASGTVICAADGSDVVCDAVAGTPSADELCDGIDNNCDGTIDDGWDELGTACTSGQGVCMVAGMRVCDGGESTKCDALALVPQVASELICDNLDNDCDGQVDEGCDDDGDGYCDQTFANMGGTVCTKGSNDCNDMVAAINPAAIEICDNIDNNCNNAVDDQPSDGVTYYLDCDGDTFAAATPNGVFGCAAPATSVAMTSCNGASTATWTDTAPMGGNIDCVDTNADFRPNQTAFFTTSGNPTGNVQPFDYNCSNVIERFDSDVFTGNINDPCPVGTYDFINNRCSAPATATAWAGSLPACGVNAIYTTCSNYTRSGSTFNCTSSTRTAAAKVQSCH